MICAGHMTGEHRTDACKGDSGGPLLCRSKEDQWVVWGIVSWGHNYFCNGSPDKTIPTVYTKVEEYLPWIRKRLRLEQCWYLLTFDLKSWRISGPCKGRKYVTSHWCHLRLCVTSHVTYFDYVTLTNWFQIKHHLKALDTPSKPSTMYPINLHKITNL